MTHYLGLPAKWLDSLTVTITAEGAKRLGMCNTVYLALEKDGPMLSNLMPDAFKKQSPCAWARMHLKPNNFKNCTADDLILANRLEDAEWYDVPESGWQKHIDRWIKAGAVRLLTQPSMP